MDLETMPRRTARTHGRRAAVLAGLLLAAAALAGCGDGGKGGSESATSPASGTATAAPAGSPSASPSPSAAAPSVPADPTATTPGPRPASPTAPATEPTPAQTRPSPGIAVGEPAPVGRQAVAYREDGKRLTIRFYGGICEKYGLKADESKPGRVDIRVVVTEPLAPGQSCAAVAKLQTVSTELKQPLMGRAVTDLGTGQLVPLATDPYVGPNPEQPGSAAPDTSGK
ncbi:hypothetical protein ACWGB8_09275 [Kitasatospora sp. NPDC054939]